MPRGEIFWDYDSPQIRKNRSRLGLDASPAAHAPLKISTPKLKISAEKRAKTVIVTSETLPKEAAEALQDLVEFSNKVLKNTEKKVSGIKEETTSAVDVNMSDDDSFLVQCSQALDILEKENEQVAEAADLVSRTDVASDVAGFEEDFGRSDSFDDILSQLASEQLEPEPATPELSEVVQRPLRPLNELPDFRSISSPVSSKGVKRFKSSDAGIPAKALNSGGGGYVGTIRRVHSSPTIPAEPHAPSKCSAAEIDRKRQEARKKRELSQMTSKRF